MAKPKIISQLSGETSCDILLATAPSANMDATTKTYVDTKASSSETAAKNAANTYTDSKTANTAKTTGATFTGTLVVNGASTLTTGQARNIYCSTSEPTSSDGQIGDIWLVYNNE